MVNWNLYIKSICEQYASWWDDKSFTGYVGKNDYQQLVKSLSFDLQANVIRSETREEEKEEGQKILNVLEGLRKYGSKHVLLSGRPGSGKSTALKRLLVEEAEVLLLETEKTQIPVLVELRYYETSILELIADFLHRYDPGLSIDSETIKTLLRQGQFFLLIDGVNELPSLEARRHLYKFRQNYQKTTPMVFTTRDLGVGGDLEIGFQLGMQPLTQHQMEDFVRGYLPETGEQMLQQLGERLREFGETPLLLKMLCSVFDRTGNQIPLNLGSVFQEFTKEYPKLKGNLQVYEDYQYWSSDLLQQLAFKMMQGSAPTEFRLNINKQEAENIFCEYLQQEQLEKPLDYTRRWLNYSLNCHLIQIGTEDKIEFSHQLIQEYYAAEKFLREVGKLNNDELQWDYLNYLKWTEPIALMLGLVDNEELALRVVSLALQVDWQLGARLAGKVRFEWQEKSVGLVEGLNVPLLLKIRLLSHTKSEAAIPRLIQLLEHEDKDVRISAVSALGEIKSEAVIPILIQLLEDKNEDIGIRNTTARNLEKIKSESGINQLIKLLSHNDLYVRGSAACALGKVTSESVIIRLIELLNDENLDVRRGAVHALRESKSEKAINSLIRLIENEQDLYIRMVIASALGDIKSEVATIQLIRLLEDEDSGVRGNAALALSNAEIESEGAINPLTKLINDENENSNTRHNALKALTMIKSEAAIPQLIQLLKHENLDVRNSANSALTKFKYEKAIPQLIQLLEHENSDIQNIAVDILAEIKLEAIVPELIKILERSNQSIVRAAAAYIMGEINSEFAIPRLTQLINDEDAFVSYHAAFALIKIKSEEAIPGLIKILEDEEILENKYSSLRENEYASPFHDAVDALAEIKSEVVITKLIEFLEHPSFDMCLHVAYVLFRIGSDSAIYGIMKLLDNKNSLLRLMATSALYKVDLEEATPRLIEFLEDESSETRSFAAQILGEIKLDAAIPGLIKLLDDDDSNVQNNAIFALGEMRSEAAIPGLIRIIENANENRRANWFYPEILDRAIPILIEIKSELVVLELIQLLEHKNRFVRKTAIHTLGKIKSEAAIPRLIQLLGDEDFGIRSSAESALEEIKSEVTMINLLEIFNNETFIQVHNGEYTPDAIKILEKIQEHLKYYKPAPIRTKHMKLSGEQRKKLQLALLDAFRSKSLLEQMLSFELDKNLYIFAPEGSLQDIVFKLIQTAEAEDWIKDLVCAARKYNDGNSNLKMIAEELL